MNQSFSLRATCLTAVLGLGAGCSTTPTVPPKKVEISEPRLNTETCLKERIKTTEIGTDEDLNVIKDSIAVSYDPDCKREKTDKALLDAQVTVDVARINASAKSLAVLLEASNIPAKEKVDTVRQIWTNLSNNSKIIRVEQAKELGEANLTPADLLRIEVVGLIAMYQDSEDASLQQRVLKEIFLRSRGAGLPEDIEKSAHDIVWQELALKGRTLAEIERIVSAANPEGVLDCGNAVEDALRQPRNARGNIVIDLTGEEACITYRPAAVTTNAAAAPAAP